MKDWLLSEAVELLKKHSLALTVGGQERLKDRTADFIKLAEGALALGEKTQPVTHVALQPRQFGKQAAAQQAKDYQKKIIDLWPDQIDLPDGLLNSLIANLQKQSTEASVEERTKNMLFAYMDNSRRQRRVFSIREISHPLVTDDVYAPVFTITNIPSFADLSRKHLFVDKKHLVRKPKPFYRQFGKSNRY